MDAYEELANAIVEQAARDYLRCCRKLDRDPDNDEAQWEIERILKFFYSGWFGVLTKIDPEYLIRRLEGK